MALRTANQITDNIQSSNQAWTQLKKNFGFQGKNSKSYEIQAFSFLRARPSSWFWLRLKKASSFSLKDSQSKQYYSTNFTNHEQIKRKKIEKMAMIDSRWYLNNEKWGSEVDDVVQMMILGFGVWLCHCRGFRAFLLKNNWGKRARTYGQGP